MLSYPVQNLEVIEVLNGEVSLQGLVAIMQEVPEVQKRGAAAVKDVAEMFLGLVQRVSGSYLAGVQVLAPLVRLHCQAGPGSCSVIRVIPLKGL